MRWIMVNIMNSQEFSCQILNRDLWSDQTVQQTIRENFYFLQVCEIRELYLRQFTQDEPEGTRYQHTYPFDQHPHIGIIDPRTGILLETLVADRRRTSQIMGESYATRRVSVRTSRVLRTLFAQRCRHQPTRSEEQDQEGT